VDTGEDLLAFVIPLIAIGILAGSVLRRIFGVPGALLAGAGSGAVGGFLLSSLLFGAIIGVVAFVMALGSGSRAARALGGRRGGGASFPIDFGGWSGGSSGGGWSSGGGGDFAGGGAGGDW
jgi:uncharacterized protein